MLAVLESAGILPEGQIKSITYKRNEKNLKYLNSFITYRGNPAFLSFNQKGVRD
jgi:hypothetical protein